MSISAEELAKRFGGTISAISPEDLAAKFGGSVAGSQASPAGPSPDSRDALSVANDQVHSYLEGTGFAHPLDTIRKIGASFLQHPVDSTIQVVKGAITTPFTVPAAAIPAAIQSVGTTGRDLGALVEAMGGPHTTTAASPQEDQAAARGAGQFLSAAPVIAGDVAGAKAVGKAAASKASPLAEALYQKGLQPRPRTFSADEITDLTKTGLDNALPISRGGLVKLDSLVNKLNDSIGSDIASNPNATLSPTAIAQRMGAPLQKAAQQVNPEADISALESSRVEFLRNHQTPEVPAVPASVDPYTGQTIPGSAAIPAKDIPIPATEAQIIKKGTYQQVGGKQFGELSSASIEGQKALARGIKEELQAQFPEIAEKNAAEGKLLDLQPELEAAINRVGNRRISVANVMNIMADPGITSRLAIILHKAGIPAAEAAARIRNFTIGLGSASSNLQDQN